MTIVLIHIYIYIYRVPRPYHCASMLAIGSIFSFTKRDIYLFNSIIFITIKTTYLLFNLFIFLLVFIASCISVIIIMCAVKEHFLILFTSINKLFITALLIIHNIIL